MQWLRWAIIRLLCRCVYSSRKSELFPSTNPGVVLALKIRGQNYHFYRFEYSATMISIWEKNDTRNNLECKFVHQNQNLCVMDPLTPHNATPALIVVCQILPPDLPPTSKLQVPPNQGSTLDPSIWYFLCDWFCGVSQRLMPALMHKGVSEGGCGPLRSRKILYFWNGIVQFGEYF